MLNENGEKEEFTIAPNIYKTIVSDGSVKMDTNYTPTDNQDVATKKFVNSATTPTQLVSGDNVLKAYEYFTPGGPFLYRVGPPIPGLVEEVTITVDANNGNAKWLFRDNENGKYFTEDTVANTITIVDDNCNKNWTWSHQFKKWIWTFYKNVGDTVNLNSGDTGVKVEEYVIDSLDSRNIPLKIYRLSEIGTVTDIVTGVVPMDDAYIPQKDQDIATKKFVEDSIKLPAPPTADGDYKLNITSGVATWVAI